MQLKQINTKQGKSCDLEVTELKSTLWVTMDICEISPPTTVFKVPLNKRYMNTFSAYVLYIILYYVMLYKH